MELVKPDFVAGDENKFVDFIKGIGKKSAERLIVELKDKLSKQGISWSTTGVIATTSENDAINALVSLGIGRTMAEQAVKKVIQKNNPHLWHYAYSDIKYKELFNLNDDVIYKYLSRKNCYKPCLHWGQRKLLLSEINFYLLKSAPVPTIQMVAMAYQFCNDHLY